MGAKGEPKTGGRKKGAQNKDTKDLRLMILAALDKSGGSEYLEKQAEKNPTAFMTLIGKVLPMQVTGDEDNPIAITEIVRKIVRPK